MDCLKITSGGTQLENENGKNQRSRLVDKSPMWYEKSP